VLEFEQIALEAELEAGDVGPRALAFSRAPECFVQILERGHARPEVRVTLHA
jgi:hypothetical protein